MWLDVLIKAKKIGLCMKYGIKEVCNDWAWHFQRCLLKLGIGPGLLTSSCTFQGWIHHYFECNILCIQALSLSIF